jgi:hypothetical protein
MKTANVLASDLLERALLHTTPTGRYDPNYTRPAVRKADEMGRGRTFSYTGKIFTSLYSPEDILTPKELAARLKVPEGWIFEKTRSRCENPIPSLRMGRFVRFDWVAVVKWLESEAVTQGNRDKRINDAKRPNNSARK